MFTSQSSILPARVTLTGQFQHLTIDPKLKITATIMQHHFIKSSPRQCTTIKSMTSSPVQIQRQVMLQLHAHEQIPFLHRSVHSCLSQKSWPTASIFHIHLQHVISFKHMCPDTHHESSKMGMFTSQSIIFSARVTSSGQLQRHVLLQANTDSTSITSHTVSIENTSLLNYPLLVLSQSCQYISQTTKHQCY